MFNYATTDSAAICSAACSLAAAGVIDWKFAIHVNGVAWRADVRLTHRPDPKFARAVHEAIVDLDSCRASAIGASVEDGLDLVLVKLYAIWAAAVSRN